MNERYIQALVIAIAGLFIAVNAIVAASSSSAFCAPCHYKQSTALKTSPHKAIRCNDCHQRGEAYDVLSWRTKVVGMVAKQITLQYRKPVVATMGTKSCLRCHAEVLKKTIEKNALKVSHREIVDGGYKCTTCHNSESHPGALANPKQATMDTCSSCHNGKNASAECELCHTKNVDQRKRVKTSWTITHGPDWKKMHGMGDLKTCVVCHGDNFCTRCHGTSIPHEEFWVKIHPKEAKKNIQACYKCHHKNYCLSCHGTEMPHPAKFFQTHSSIVEEKGDKLCLRCHLESGCDRCHDRHKHPGIERERLRQLKREAGIE